MDELETMIFEWLEINTDVDRWTNEQLHSISRVVAQLLWELA